MLTNLVFGELGKFLKPAWVYLHYPICQHHCSYCDFNVVSRSLAPEGFEAAWLQTIERQLSFFSESSRSALNSFYLGGGTPSLISLDGLEKLRRIFERHYSFSGRTEFTIECNPENLSATYLDGLRELGVNRISLGVQTSLPNQLRRLERLATFKNVFESIDEIKKRFSNFSLDFMIGIPDQSLESLEEDLKFIQKVEPPHLSIYLLTLSNDHKLKTSASTRHRIADSDLASKMYHRVCDFVRELGYLHYEVSNFSKPGFESQHNRNYWDSASDYLGLGPGAHGYLRFSDQIRVRYETERDLRAWLSHLTGIASFENLDAEQQRLERLYLRLRTGQPVDVSDIQLPKFSAFEREGLAMKTPEGIVLTERGWLVIESLSSDLLL